jgi:Mg2+ and Co2+ transporter CorA
VECPALVRAFLQAWPVTWVNVEGLGDATVIRQLGELFGLHRLALEDVINVHQRAKGEQYGEHHGSGANIFDHTTYGHKTDLIIPYVAYNKLI